MEGMLINAIAAEPMQPKFRQTLTKEVGQWT